ncbi:MAG: lpxL 1 [Burkholderiaceae bacterium]|nr:lpxL 1 [Burkholderiaceae bacterium]
MAGKSKWQIWSAQWAVRALKNMGDWSDTARYRVGARLAWLASKFAKRRMNIARTNLSLCFPSWTDEQIERVAQQQMRYFVQALMDRSLFWFGAKEAVFSHIALQDEHFLNEALAQKRPIILLAPHFVGLDAGGMRINMMHPVVSMYQRQSNPVFDQMVLEGRSRTGQAYLYSRHDGARKLIKLLRDNIPLYYLPDMDFGRKDSIFSEFFGQPATTLTALPKLAGLTQALIVPCVTRIDVPAFDQGKTRYITQFYPAWDGYPQGSEEQAVRQMNQFIEERIIEDPAQYLWMHKRFKTRPEGMAGVY